LFALDADQVQFAQDELVVEKFLVNSLIMYAGAVLFVGALQPEARLTESPITV
jgi:hypothetical protein